jgi:hypothetical protein
MASRPPRTSKSDSASKPSPTGQAEKQGGDLEAGAVIKDSSLERREIPSYSDTREARIAEAAYWRAERRGFAPGGELEDWLQAERELDEQQQQSDASNEERGDRSRQQ